MYRVHGTLDLESNENPDAHFSIGSIYCPDILGTHHPDCVGSSKKGYTAVVTVDIVLVKSLLVMLYSLSVML